MRYDYEDMMKNDIKEYLQENYTNEEIMELDYDTLFEELWVADSVTGNGSGSYTFNAWKAEENICHNMDLAQEAFEEFGYEGIPFDKGAEYIDVSIRCYMLGQVLSDTLHDIQQEIENDEESE